jgi:hypothetical protein
MKIASTNNQVLFNRTTNTTNAERCGTPTLKDKTKTLSFQDQILAIDKNKIVKCGSPTLIDKTKTFSFQDQMVVMNKNNTKIDLFANKKIN